MVTRQLIMDWRFDLDAILDGTQDFRWRAWRDDWHSGVLSGNLIHIRRINRGVEYRADSDLDALLISYFRLDDDIDAIHADIACRDDKVATLVKKYPCLRILRQPDPWECMVSYICSANNNVARISKIVEKIAEALGRADRPRRRGAPYLPHARDGDKGRNGAINGAEAGPESPLQDNRRRRADTRRQTGPVLLVSTARVLL